MTNEDFREIRETFGLSLADVAKRLKYNRHYLSAVECGTKPFTSKLEGKYKKFISKYVEAEIRNIEKTKNKLNEIKNKYCGETK